MIKPMTKEEIESICSEDNVHQSTKKWKFWVSEVYGLGRALREYSYFYPHKLPLYIYINHGVYFCEPIWQHEIESEAPMQFYNWNKSIKKFKEKSKKPCFQIEWPYIFYRKNHNIQRVEKPEGTIVYPSHSTPLDKETFDITSYMQQLRNLPEEFHPLYVCLHKHDIAKGVHKTYLDAGFNVCTAGHYSDDSYIDRFYDIMKHFKYSMSNEVSTYTFLSVEMGVPFFIYGEKSKMINLEDENYEIGEMDFNKFEGYKEAYELFLKDPFKDKIAISKDQLDYVNDKLGKDSGVSRLQFTILLWWAILVYRFSIIRMIKKFIKLKFA